MTINLEQKFPDWQINWEIQETKEIKNLKRSIIASFVLIFLVAAISFFLLYVFPSEKTEFDELAIFLIVVSTGLLSVGQATYLVLKQQEKRLYRLEKFIEAAKPASAQET